MSRPLFHRIKQHGKEFIACVNECDSKYPDQPSEANLCKMECYQGKGVENIKLFDYYRGRGVCFPDACSAEEILILLSNVGDVENIVKGLTSTWFLSFSKNKN